MKNINKRYIEDTFPVKEVGIEGAREKNIKFGHISTFHTWWSRKPLATSRVTSYAALIPSPKNEEEMNSIRDFIIKFSKWENTTNFSLVERARKEICANNEGKTPKILDPFAGGGSIPLESLRLGCETYSNDLNPLAIFLQKSILEFPQEFGNENGNLESWGVLNSEKKINQLVKDVQYWVNWVSTEVNNELTSLYLEKSQTSTTIAYLWARTIPCQNPLCGIEIPLKPQYWIVRKPKKKIALYPYLKNSKIEFKLVGDGFEEIPDGFDPDVGSIARANVVCPICQSVFDANTTRKLFRDGNAGQKLLVIVTTYPNVKGKTYRIANETDIEIYDKAIVLLEDKIINFTKKWGFNPVPDEPLPPTGTLGFRIQRYDFRNWGDLYNSRQLLAIITFMEKIKLAYENMVESGYEIPYAKAITCYLALALDMVAANCNRLCRWKSSGEGLIQIFSRQAIPMIWDYAEANPIGNSPGSWNSGWKYYLKVIEFCTMIPSNSAKITQNSATDLPYSDNFFDAIFTDPPYYDNVPYSYLSDFFYVWMKRTIGELFPEYFSTSLTPKSNEIVAYSHGEGGIEEGKKFFESMLKKAFQEMNRVLKIDGIAVIVYAHKSNEGWETLINSLLDSGLVITGAWPLNTELTSRLRSQDSATLSSSIYLIARKIERKGICLLKDLREELINYLQEKLQKLWQEGISGGDFFIAAIGSAIEIFGKYEQVIDLEGNPVRAGTLLDEVRNIATDYAVNQILKGGVAGEISNFTRFYVLWRWNYKTAKVDFDEAHLLAQSCGFDLSQEFNKGFIRKSGKVIEILGPEKRDQTKLEGSSELIDVLHNLLLLWEQNNKDDIEELLRNSGWGRKEVFYRVAQAISETLPTTSREKKLLEGFLAGRENMKKKSYQRTFTEFISKSHNDE